MLPKMPPPRGQAGFLYVPPFRIQGISVAGEQTVIQVPELDVCFDIGSAPRFALNSTYIALSHGHMDHVGGLPYYFSQRVFQRMGIGTCVCHPAVAPAVEKMMASWSDLERQKTPHVITPLGHGEEIPIKNNIALRAIEVSHACPANGYALVEYRSKLRDEYRDLPQEKLRDLKQSGTEITRSIEIPLIAYTGDTQLTPNLFCDSFAHARVIISECTFFEDDHRQRATVGKHLHVDDLAKLLDVWDAEMVILTHVSRRTNIGRATQILRKAIKPKDRDRVHLLMDHRTNRMRYQQQCAAAEHAAQSRSGGSSGGGSDGSGAPS